MSTNPGCGTTTNATCATGSSCLIAARRTRPEDRSCRLARHDAVAGRALARPRSPTDPTVMTESQLGFVSKRGRRPTWVRWRLTLILMGLTGLNPFHRQSLPAVVDDVMRDCRFT